MNPEAAVLELLEADRDDCGPGVPRSTLERVCGLRHLGAVLTALRAEGYVIGVNPAGGYELGHERTKAKTESWAA